MHIEFERTGGVAGIRFVANVDTDTLSADEAPPVRRRLELLPPASSPHGLDAGGGSNSIIVSPCGPRPLAHGRHQ
jgi:hypothetical protein